MGEIGVTPLWESMRRLRIKNQYILGAFGEFWGTFILCLFAVGAGIQSTIQCETSNNGVSCHYIFPLLGGVLGLMIAITIFGGVSGAHVNPAVTLGLAISGKIGWAKVPLYWFMQFFGAYLGSGLAYGLYADLVEDLVGGPVTDNPLYAHYASAFAPLPNERVLIALADQIIGTAILVMIVHAAIDERNMKVPTFFYGFLFASTVAAINFAFGIQAGGVLNPARDISARLMAISIGFKAEDVFTIKVDSSTYQYWAAPMFGPLIGGMLGAVMYIVFVGGHLEDNEKPVQMMQNGQQYGQQQARPDWRSTEFIRHDQGPMSPNKYNNNIPPPPPPQKEKKKSKFGFKDALKAGKSAGNLAGNLDTSNFEALGDMNFDDVGGAIDSAKQIHETGKQAYDMGKDGYDLGKQGYDAYQGYNQGRGQPQGRGGQVSQNRGGQRGPSGYNQGW